MKKRQGNIAMKVNLRKAAVIQNDLLEFRNKHPLPGLKIELDEFISDISEKVSVARQQFMLKQEQHRQLWEVYYSIRNKVALVNSQVGIVEILAKLEMYKKWIELERELSTTSVPRPIEEIMLRLDKMRKMTPGESGFHSSSFSVAYATVEDIKESTGRINEYRRKIRQLNDKLLELNVTSEIELSLAEVKYLENAGIL